MKTANTRILVVEDEIIISRSIQNKLEALGYEVSGMAASGTEAVRQAAARRPDLVLMDIRLKGEMDGIEAAQQIRARLNIPVIYLTAYADNDTVQRAQIAEPFGYLVKPFEKRELHAAIETALYMHSAERRLKKLERWLATTLRSIGDAVIATDTAGGITFMNPMAEALTGWPAAEASGKALTNIFRIINEETRAVVDNPVEKVLREGVGVGLADHTLLIARDGREIPIDDSAAPIRDDQENIIGAVFVFRDVTQQKQAQKALQTTYAELKEKSEETESFIYIISHDLKSPLVSIRGFLTVLRSAFDGKLGQEEQFCLDRVEANIIQLETLIQDLLELSRVGRKDTNLEAVNLNEVLEDILKRADYQIKAKGVEIKIQSGFPHVMANPHRLDQVFTNLIENAINYMGGQTHPRIEIGFREEGDDWLFHVKDNGIGIPEKHHQRIFNIFERLPEAKDLSPQGTGVGLAIVKKIVESHKGKLRVESEAGRGSTFYFTLARK